MSIIIHGMDMPKNCYDCLFERPFQIYAAKSYCIITGRKVESCDRPSWCPLGEIPPHGRLIDGDALLREAKKQSGPMTGDGWDNWGVYALIERQPTIIEAEWVKE